MAGNYAQLLDIINNPTQHSLPAWDNNNKLIEGLTIKQYLLTIIQSLTAGYQYMGVATPSTSPGTPDQNVFYIAGVPGEYSNFGTITVDAGTIAVLSYNGSWSKSTIAVPIVDQKPTADTTNVHAAPSNYTELEISNINAYIGGISIMTPRDGILGTPDWAQINSTHRHICLMVSPGDSFYLKSSGTIAIGFLKTYNYDGPVSGNPDFSAAPDFTARIVRYSNDVLNVTVPNDTHFVVFTVQNAGSVFYPTTVKVNGYDLTKNIIQNIAIQCDTIFDYVDKYPTAEQDNKHIPSSNGTQLEIDNQNGRFYGIQKMVPRDGILGTPNWVGSDASTTRKHLCLKVNPGDVIDITVSGANAIGFLKTYNYNGPVSGNPDFSDQSGYNARIVLDSTSGQYTVPSDVRYFVFTIQNGATIVYPTALKINGFDMLVSLPTKIVSVDMTPQVAGTGAMGSNYVEAAMANIGTRFDGLMAAMTPRKGIIGPTTWSNIDSTHKHFLLFVRPGDVVKFKASATLALAVMKSYPFYGDPSGNIDFSSSEGYTERFVLYSTTPEQTYVIPNDSHYLAFNIQNGSAMFYPTVLSINGYNLLDSLQNKLSSLDSRITAIEQSESTTAVRNTANRLAYISKISKLARGIQYPNADLNVLMLYGQSLACAYEGTNELTTENVGGNLCPGPNGYIMYPFYGSGFSTLINNLSTNGGYEPCVLHAANRLKKEIDNQFLGLANDKKMVAALAGKGGQAIEQLLKTWDQGLVDGKNEYTAQFLPALQFIKAQADAAEKSVVCPVLMFMQGEANSIHVWGQNQDGTTPSGSPTSDKDTYKAYLLALKNSMQADVMATFGQSEKPLFVMYVPGQRHTADFNVPIQRAFVEFMQENEDVIISAPTYPSPDYGSHLTSNGYRMLGEMFGKRLYQAFIKGEKHYPLIAENVEISGNKITVNIPTIYPLVKDIYGVKEQTNLGFQVKKNGTLISIDTITVDETFVVLECSTELTGTIEIAYANNESPSSDLAIVGHGNIRNTDPFDSMYNWGQDSQISSGGNPITYEPKDLDGVALEGSGKQYHCYDWLLPFYFQIVL